MAFMSDPLPLRTDMYGRVIVPEARGKAEAMRTWLAQGGGLTRSGHFKSGPMRGKTMDQAGVEFERMWASVDGRVQDKYAAMQGIGSLSPSELAQNRQLITGLQRPTPAGDSFGQSPARVNKPVVKNDTGVAGTSNVVAGPPNSQPQADFEARRKYTPSPGYGVDGKPLAVPFPTSKEISEFNQKIVDGGLRSVGDGSPNISTKGSMPKIMIKGADGQMRPETLGEEAARVGTAGPSGTGPSGMAQLSAPSVDIANAATRKVTAENRAANGHSPRRQSRVDT